MQNLMYRIDRVSGVCPGKGLTAAPVWDNAQTLEVMHFHPDSTAHRPQTTAALVWDASGVFIRFVVRDRFVRCLQTEHQGPVCGDSCVEWFVEPVPGRGYFSFEMNCGGALLAIYCPPSPSPGRPKPAAELIGPEWFSRFGIDHTMPRVVDPEITEPVEWRVAWYVPFGVFEQYLGPVRPAAGQRWRANFYKIGSKTSHPHWACWSPIGHKRSFHQPVFFAPVEFQ